MIEKIDPTIEDLNEKIDKLTKIVSMAVDKLNLWATRSHEICMEINIMRQEINDLKRDGKCY